MELSDMSENGSFLAPTLAVRVSNISVERLEELRFTRSAELIDQILDTQDRLTDTGKEIADGLYPVIGDPGNAAVKPLLVALRRAVHGNRLPALRARSPEVLARVPGHLRTLLHSWLEDLQRRHSEYAALPDLIAEERAHKYAVLRETVADPVFQHGLVQGSPVLFERLRAWLAAAPGTEPERKVALRLMKYLARVVAKTSPYSTFVSAGTMPTQPTRSRGAGAQHTLCHRYSVLELNTWISDRIRSALWQREGADPDPLLRLNPSAVVVGEHVLLLAEEKGKESIRAVAAAPAIRHVVDHLVRVGPILRSVLTRQLEEVSGQSSAGERFIQQTLSVGLLEPCPTWTDQEPDPVAVLGGEESPSNAGVGSALGELGSLMSLLPRTQDPEERSERLRRVHTTLAGAFTGLGLEPGELPPKNVVHESALLSGHPPELGQGPWQDVHPELDSIRRFTALFRPDLPFKLACARFFSEHCPAGKEVPFMEFYRDAVRLMSASSGENPLGSELATHLLGSSGPLHDPGEDTVPGLGTVADLQKQARSRLLDRPAGEHGICVGRSELDQMSARWPGYVQPPESVTFYLQTLFGTDVQDAPLAVMNECATGYGRGRRRIDGLLRDRTAPLSAPERYRHHTVLLAECDANFGHRLNVRPPATDHCIDYPGSFSGRSAQHRIALGDLVVGPDPDSGLLLLRSQRTGLPVRPLHLGLLGDFLLPRAFAFLIKAFGEPPSLIYQSWSPFVDMAPWSGQGEPDGVHETPRITVDGVVVARKTHHVHARNFPRRKKGEDDAVHMVRLASCLKEHGIPRRCFVRVLSPEWRAGRSSALTKARKPVYVDFDNMLLSASLERSITSDDDLLVIQEALPDPRQAPYLGAERHTTEYVAEISAGAVLE